MNARYLCCDEHRRAGVDAHPTLSGIDWLEVLDLDAPAGSPRQRTLFVRLLKPVPAGLTPDHVRITGGERIRRVGIEWVGVASAPPVQALPAEVAWFTALPQPDHVLLVRTDTEGDFSPYRLFLVQGAGSTAPLPDFDPRLSDVEFSFKVECPSDFDCGPRTECPEDPRPVPDLNHLARDYASLRRLVVDRLGQQMPGWQDRSPADLATTLAEVLAYVGDLQHYTLDAISTEGYLHTARRRSSLRRHALLVDYRVDEGSNARTWLHLEVSGAAFPLPAGIRFLTRVPGASPRITPASSDERAARLARPLVFEPMMSATLRIEHNIFDFHTWGDERCCLPVGATRATLRGHWPNLAPGDVLVFQEMRGPRTGLAEDADPTHRHAVRLVEVRAFDGTDPLVDPLPDPSTGTLTQISEIAWHDGDALPFPLCISSETDEEHGSALIVDVSRVLGNNVLVDHGDTIADEPLGVLQRPYPPLQFPPPMGRPCARPSPVPLPLRFRPLLANAQVTHQGTVLKIVVENGVRRTRRLRFDPDAAASAALVWNSADAVPAVAAVSSTATGHETWEVRRDLLDSRATDRHFVLETDDDGTSRLRFGDDAHGRRPDVDMTFQASYRVGSGPGGNVGSGSIAHAVTSDGRITSVTNPLAAVGGAAPETSAQVRRRAPQAFRTQERAVTPSDYAAMTERLPGVQRAAASLRWTGSWHTVFTTVDRETGASVDAAFASAVVAHLDRYRMAGHDVRVNEPVHVSLEIDMLVCVDTDYFRSNVRLGLMDVFSRRLRLDGTRALFHPDNFSFGQTVYLSPLYAAARTVAGVSSVQITRFQRQGVEDPQPLANGFMALGRLEIPRLDNDPNFPEHGVLRLDLYGGK